MRVKKEFGYISSVQSLSRVRLFATPWTAAHQASLSITNSRSPPKPMSIVSVMPSNHLILCHALLLLPSIFPSIKVFSNESALRIRWPKYWSFSFNISPSNEHPGLISFRTDWLDLLAVQGTLKSLLQHHSICKYLSNGWTTEKWVASIEKYDSREVDTTEKIQTAHNIQVSRQKKKKKKIVLQLGTKALLALKEIKRRETRNMERGQIPEIKKKEISEACRTQMKSAGVEN